MGWTGSLRLHYRRDPHTALPRTVAHDRHDGPLRVLASLYPEGPAVCHHVLVHPPGGVVGGDRLEVALALDPGAHALVTTPGATRFYRSAGDDAVQTVQATLAEGARLEWLPLESIAHDGCIATNALQCTLAPGAEMLGWDLLALGLPASDRGFVQGRFTQRIELPGRWLERGTLDGGDTRLLDSPLGLAGRRVLATMWFAVGGALDEARREALLDAARAVVSSDVVAGISSPEPGLVVLRLLADRVEPAMQRLTAVRAAWRRIAWDLDPAPPRVWST